MNAHPMRGALFENLCVSEYGKHLRNTGAAFMKLGLAPATQKTRMDKECRC